MRNLFATFTLLSFLMFASGAGAQIVVSTIDGVPIGATTPSTGEFTNLTLGTTTITEFSEIADDNTVESAPNDSTAGLLFDELQEGTNVSITTIDIGGNKKVSISAPDKLNNPGDLLYNNGSIETALGVGGEGQVLTTFNGLPKWENPVEGNDLFNSNVLLNTYRTAENGNVVNNLPPLKIINGIVDAFGVSEVNLLSGVDDTTSNNFEYVANDNLYKPTGNPGVDIPVVNFDGTNDYLTILDGTLGQSDGKTLLISFWIDPDANGTNNRILHTRNNRLGISHNIDDRIQVIFRNSAGAVLANVDATTRIKADDGLVHVLIAVDLGATTPTIQFRIDGAPLEGNIVRGTPNPILDDEIDFTDIEVTIGAIKTSSVFNHFSGDMAQFYLAEQYLDISDDTNLAKFIDPNGDPVDLGDNGENPLNGTQPRIFLNDPTASWQDNLGQGGNFTENGILTDGQSFIAGSATIDDMTLISKSQTAKNEPTDANILLLAEGDIALDGDLKVFVSKDGGTIFEEVGLGTDDVGDFEDGKLYTGTVALTGSGTDMQWKVETVGKDIKLHGVGLEWR